MAAEIRIIGIRRSHAVTRRGEERYAYMGLLVGKSDKIREVRLGEDDLVRLIRDAAVQLAVERGISRV